MNTLRLSDISLGYGRKVLCSGLSAELASGECVLLCGPNGSGKTTLLKVIAGLAEPLGGRVERAGRAALVPTRIPKVKGFTLIEFIATGCYRQSRWSGALKDPSAALDAMQVLGIEELEKRDISSLSDGEFQKGCIAAALCSGAELLLLDEPTAFLDPEGRASILLTLKNLCRTRGTSVLFSSHDLAESLPGADALWGLDGHGAFFSGRGEEKARVARSCFRKIPIFEGLAP